MSDTALAEPQHRAAMPQSSKRQRISPRIRRAIDALVFGEAKTQKEAARIAGLNNEHLCRELKKPQIEAFYAQRVRLLMRRAQMRAGSRIVSLLDAASEHVSLDASKHVLAIAGIAPPQSSNSVNISINNTVAPGYVVMQPQRTTLELEPAHEPAANPLLSQGPTLSDSSNEGGS